MQTLCYWTKRPELSQKAESFAKEKANHDTRIYRRNRVFTIAGVAFLSISGVSIAGCLLRMLAHIIAGVPDDDPQFYIWRLFLSLSTLAVGLILFRVRPVLEELPWPDWYAQYMLDEARLQILLSGKPVRVSGMVDRFGRRLPECEAYRGIADFDSRMLFLLFQAGPGRKFCVITSLDDMTFIPYG